LEHFFSTDQKLRLAEELILSGFQHVELTNFGHPKYLPQFADAEVLLDRLFDSERVGHLLRQNGGTVTVTAVTINERAVDRALDYKARRGHGPDILLQMVSTDPLHHKVNSGTTLDDYWAMTERCTAKAAQAGMAMCGTVSTIWGSPLADRQTTLDTAIEFARRYLELGAAYIEHADHDGSADPARVYDYFRRVLDPARLGEFADPKFHLAHFHSTRGMGLANYLAALQAGVRRFESTLSGVGGQPANIVDGRLVGGTGAYYHAAHSLCGLVGTEDFVIMAEAMGIRTGIDIERLLGTGRLFRDEFLAFTQADVEVWAERVSELTGLAATRIEGARGLGDLREAELAAAAERLAVAHEQPIESARQSVEGLLRTIFDLRSRGAWAPSRAETLDSGLPPSPHLMKYLRRG
jgi:hydroxymethylglutaryl-CoA lyase